MIDLKTPPITPTTWSVTRARQLPQNLLVVCLCYGDKYPDAYVQKLQEAVASWLNPLRFPHNFVCLSDREIDHVFTVQLPPHDLAKNREGWWKKVYLFRPGLFTPGTRVLYLDLDVVITGSLEVLAKQWTDKALTMIYNFGPNRGHCAHNSSVMLWTAGDERLAPIYTDYRDDPERVMNALHGDQCWIWRVLRDDVANFPRDYIASYKYEYRGRKVDPDARVVVFHGDPKPHQCREPWVDRYWHQLS